MAISLADMAKQSAAPMQKGFILDLLRYSDLLNTVSFDNVPGLKVAGKRWQTLSNAGFRQLNGGYTESTGTIEEVGETLAFLGGDIKVDKAFDKADSGSIEKPLVTQMKMKAKAVAFAFNNAFINGNQAVNPDSFEGLLSRVSNMSSRMTLWQDASSNGTGASLKVLASAANEKQLITAMHKANKYVGGATHIFMNENSVIGIGQVLRDLGITYQPVALWDKTWESFQGVPFVDVGLQGDKSTEIITNTETVADNTATSMYFVRMDSDDGLRGIQMNGMDMNVYDPLNGNETEGGPQYLRRVDWAVGLFNLSQYSIARVCGFKMAAS
jgi:hypothetical protein